MATRTDPRIERLEELAERRGLSSGALISWLQTALDTPLASRGDPERELTAAEEAVLTEEGLGAGELDATAIQRSAESFLRMLAEALTAKEAAELLEISDSRVRQLLGERRLYGVKVDGDWRLPRWQFVGNQPVPGLDRVLPRFSAGLHPLAVQGFLRSPKPELLIGNEEVSPLEWLISGGDPEPVAELAAEI